LEHAAAEECNGNNLKFRSNDHQVGEQVKYERIVSEGDRDVVLFYLTFIDETDEEIPFREPQNLKAILTDLGNMLVTHHGFDPAVPTTRRSTNAIKDFTEWLNSCPEAVELLNQMGFDWPTLIAEQRYNQLARMAVLTPEQQHQFEELSASVERGCD